MADKKKKSKIKGTIGKLSKIATVRGIGVGGKIYEGKGKPAKSVGWKVGIIKGAGVKGTPRHKSRTDLPERGRKARAGFKIKVKW